MKRKSNAVYDGEKLLPAKYHPTEADDYYCLYEHKAVMERRAKEERDKRSREEERECEMFYARLGAGSKAEAYLIAAFAASCMVIIWIGLIAFVVLFISLFFG